MMCRKRIDDVETMGASLLRDKDTIVETAAELDTREESFCGHVAVHHVRKLQQRR